MKKPLLKRLDEGPVICGEGYLFELERRGYLQAGSFVPEVALNNPEVLEEVHRDFVKTGSDIVQAFTYNGHREKMRIIGKEEKLESLNRSAIRVAKKVASDFNDEPLVAGNVSNTNIFDPSDHSSKEKVRLMFSEMIGWCKEENVDMIIGETFYYLEEALLALEVMKQHNFTSVITLGIMAENILEDGYTPTEACKILKDNGADVVGLNCFRGPETMLDIALDIRRNVSGHIAVLPVTYRTTAEEPTFFNITDKKRTACPQHGRCFPDALEPLYCNRYEIAEFAKKAYENDIRYLGLCCGCNPAFLRAMAEAVGRNTINSEYSPDITKHFLYGKDPTLKKHIQDLGNKA